MLRGTTVGLRARFETDVPILHAELYDDVATRVRADTRPWRPIPPGSPASPVAVADGDDREATFSVVRLRDDELAGYAVLWNIDTYNRAAHVGLSLRPSFRGQGLGLDVVRVLCRYGFAIRGLHRLQLETLVDNHAMIQTATRAGFVPEGTLRRASWVDGEFVDEVLFGLLVEEWTGS
jgi:RimJ/RimL family protein N-acetyltransferase